MLVLANWGLTYNSTAAFTTADSGLGFSLFTRRYWGNRCCFLFQRLVICLSSARRSWIADVGEKKRKPRRPQDESYETARSPKAEALHLS